MRSLYLTTLRWVQRYTPEFEKAMEATLRKFPEPLLVYCYPEHRSSEQNLQP
jgi:hypothetical protein